MVPIKVMNNSIVLCIQGHVSLIQCHLFLENLFLFWFVPYFVSLVKIRAEVHRGRLYYFALYFIVLVPEFLLLCTERLRRSNITLFSVIFVISSWATRCLYMPPSYLTTETSFGVVFTFLPWIFFLPFCRTSRRSCSLWVSISALNLKEWRSKISTDSPDNKPSPGQRLQQCHGKHFPGIAWAT